MEGAWLQPFLVWIGMHPSWAGLAVFTAALLESLFIVGLFIPGFFIMFGVGALVAGGAMGLLPTLLWAATGAVVGDGLSFTLGYHYRGRLHDIWPISRYPNLIARGEAFFERHGGKSVVFGRFVGPVRPIVPAIAGAAGMPLLRFFIVNVVSAVLWAPSYILPGVVFGASLGLAAQVASRLAVLAVLVLGLVWLIVWLTRYVFTALQKPVEHALFRLLDWSQRHRRLGHLGRSLADPQQPETPGLAIVALILLIGGWVAFSLVWGITPDKHPTQVDALLYHLLAGLRTPWTDPIAAALAQLSGWPVYLPIALAVLAGLLTLGRIRAALHWAAAIAFGAALAGGLHWLLQVPAPIAFYTGSLAHRQASGGHMILSTVIYGFLPVLLTSSRAEAPRWPYYGCAGTLMGLIALARLYLGAQWFSEAAIGTGVALLWVTLLALAYRRHRTLPLPPRPLLALALVTLGLAATYQWTTTLPAYAAGFRIHGPVSTMSQAQWLGGGYAKLPAYRIDLEGRRQYPLNVQWVGSLDRIKAALATHGWQAPPPLRITSALRWLSSGAPIGSLPVLPQMHDGRNEALVMVQPQGPKQQRIIRLWPTYHRIKAANDESLPLWQGNVTLQHVWNLASIAFIPADENNFNRTRAYLADQLNRWRVDGEPHPQAQPVPPRIIWDGQVLLVYCVAIKGPFSTPPGGQMPGACPQQ